jgi:hypothetical protein
LPVDKFYWIATEFERKFKDRSELKWTFIKLLRLVKGNEQWTSMPHRTNRDKNIISYFTFRARKTMFELPARLIYQGNE